MSADIALTNGVGTFAVTPVTIGLQTLTAADVESGVLVGSESILATPGWGARIVATPLTATVAGQTQNTKLTVYDAFGNVSTVYTGTVQVTTTDPQAPVTWYTFTAADAGIHTLPVTLKTAGAQAVTISDLYNPAVATTQAGLLVTPATAASISVSALQVVTAGTAQSFTVSARDMYGNTATGYRGTVSVSSSDTQATLPAAYTFTAADAGSRAFSMTFKTSTGQTFMVTDAANPAFTILQTDIRINAASVAGFAFRAPSNVTAGVAFNVTVSAVDAYGNTVVGYTGTVHFTGPGGTGNILPANYTFSAGDQGSHVFSFTLASTGTQTIGVQDTLLTSLKAQLSEKVVVSSSGGGGATGGGGGGSGGGGGGEKVVV